MITTLIFRCLRKHFIHMIVIKSRPYTTILRIRFSYRTLSNALDISNAIAKALPYCSTAKFHLFDIMLRDRRWTTFTIAVLSITNYFINFEIFDNVLVDSFLKDFGNCWYDRYWLLVWRISQITIEFKNRLHHSILAGLRLFALFIWQAKNCC